MTALRDEQTRNRCKQARIRAATDQTKILQESVDHSSAIQLPEAQSI